MSRPRPRGWFKPRFLNGGKIDPRINVKGRRKGSKNRPRIGMQVCPNCHYRMTKEHRRALKRMRALHGGQP